MTTLKFWAIPGGRAVLGVGLRPLACWDCGFEFPGEGEDIDVLSSVCVVCCQVRQADPPPIPTKYVCVTACDKVQQ